MKEELVELHAHVCGDGWITEMNKRRSAWDINHYNRRRVIYKEWQIGYSNKEPLLLRNFKRTLEKLTNNFIEIRKNEVRVRDKKLFEKLKKLGCGKSREWFIDERIVKGEKAKKLWLRAFFDDEATVETKNHNRIRIKSTNLRGLKQIKKLLSDLKIHAKITGPNKDNTWYITISSRKELLKFKKIVGFSHPQKVRQLNLITY